MSPGIFLFIRLAAAISSVWLAFAAEPALPVEQQTAMVRKYCVACHNDTARNGGLSLQYFNAENADASLAAMLVSKIRSGALGAAGLPTPDPAVRSALVAGLTAQAARAHEWNIAQGPDPRTHQPTVTAGIARHLPGRREAGEAAVYRLLLSCNLETREGEAQLSWSPSPVSGTLHVALDGKAQLSYPVEGIEKMGNGIGATTGPAAVTFVPATHAAAFVLPAETLTISNLFPGESITFPFNALAPSARASLAACFAAGAKP